MRDILLILPEGLRCTEICNEKLESNGQHFKNMTELTEFIKENNTTISKPVSMHICKYQ